MTPCRHRVNYYETDKMGITHHANYLHWMEEARVDFLDQLGWSYARLEELGVFSPVTSLECAYRAPTTFGDLVDVTVAVREYRGARLVVGYEMRRADGTLVLTGTSSHCFLDREGRLLRLKKVLPGLDALLRRLAEEARRLGQVISMRPLPAGTRQMAPQLLQVKYRCSLSLRRCRAPWRRPLRGSHQPRNRWFSARRRGRFLEKMRKITTSSSQMTR